MNVEYNPLFRGLGGVRFKVFITLLLLLSGCSVQEHNKTGMSSTVKPMVVEERYNRYQKYGEIEVGITDRLHIYIPEYLKRHIVSLVVGNTDEGYGESNGAAGLAWVNSGEILINPDYINSDHVIYHEIGHLIDYKFAIYTEDDDFNKLSTQDDWVSIWNKEWKDTDNYGAESFGEGFAEAFSAYYTGITDYKDIILRIDKPLTHKYMASLDKIVKEYKPKNILNLDYQFITE